MTDDQERLDMARTGSAPLAGPEIADVGLTQAAHAHGLALALPEKVGITT